MECNHYLRILCVDAWLLFRKIFNIQINIMATFERTEIGRLALVQETEDGRIRQIGLTEEQSKQLQFYCALISEGSPLVQMGEEYDLFLKEQKQLKLCEVGVTFKDKNTPTFEEWYDDIYTQMYLKESAFKKYFEMSEEELLLRYKKKFKIKP